jgi:hypothetical protein
MMNKQNRTRHTEIEYPSSNAMEQAALLKAHCAMARWRSDQIAMGNFSDGSSAREEWYAALEQRLYEWIGQGGLAQDGEVRAVEVRRVPCS